MIYLVENTSWYKFQNY